MCAWGMGASSNDGGGDSFGAAQSQGPRASGVFGVPLCTLHRCR